MKKKCSYLMVMVIFLLSLTVLRAQERAEVDNTRTSRIANLFRYEEQISNFLQLQQSDQNASVNEQPIRSNSLGNVAFIEQIGQGNQIQAANLAGTSNLFYLQRGNRNTIANINALNTTVNQRILQNGNNNGVLAISSGDLNIIQNGNGIIFEQIGTNPVTNNIQLRLEGGPRTVSVRTLGLSNAPNQ